jgi:hypothetical protein
MFYQSSFEVANELDIMTTYIFFNHAHVSRYMADTITKDSIYMQEGENHVYTHSIAQP